MMEQEEYEMQDYQLVNPYEMIYRNMNFEINQAITKDTAEKIARQLGFMHNAFGVVAKDLIKIVGLRFKEHQQPRDDRQREKERKRDREGLKAKKRSHPEDMEVEEREEGSRMRKKVVVSLDSSGEGELLRASREGSVGFAQKGTDQLPPNSHIFDEYEYQKSGHEESKKTAAPVSRFDASFKERLSKIVEQVANKRRKPAPPPDPIPQQPQIPSSPMPAPQQQNKQEPSPNGQATSQANEPKEQQSQAAFLQEFEYRSNHSSDKAEKQDKMVPEQGTNRLRLLLQQKDREEGPPVYEISDDE